MVFYSLALDMETHALLCNTLHNLLNMTYKTFLNELRQQVSEEEKKHIVALPRTHFMSDLS